MPDPVADTVASIGRAATRDERVALVRRIPEQFGMAHQAEIYSAVAAEVYARELTPDFAFVHWSDDYELSPFELAYAQAMELTAGFTRVSVVDLEVALEKAPAALRVFRVILGLTRPELAAASGPVAIELAAPALTVSHVKSMEAGRRPRGRVAQLTAHLLDRMMTGRLFPAPSPPLRSKLAKPDTADGWETVRRFATQGVPYATFLHQRLYGGAFRQLLDATSTQRGDSLEAIVKELFERHGIPFVHTGAGNQDEIARRFGITVRPAPDFVVFDGAGGRETLRAMIECKWTNDGGTARDKAARFRSLREEALRLGGVPVFAVLAGLGWSRTADALGPVVRDTDGRVFLPSTIGAIVETEPFPGLVGRRVQCTDHDVRNG